MESYIASKIHLYNEYQPPFYEENYHQDYHYEEEEPIPEDIDEENLKEALEIFSKTLHLVPKKYLKGVTEIIQGEELEGTEDQMKLIFIKIQKINNYIQEKKEKQRTMKKLWGFATQMLYLVPKTNLRSVKGILMEFEDKEEEIEEEELLASIITRISDYSKEEIEKEKKLKKSLNKSTPIRQCQRTQENQPQKESLTLSSYQPESYRITSRKFKNKKNQVSIKPNPEIPIKHSKDELTSNDLKIRIINNVNLNYPQTSENTYSSNMEASTPSEVELVQNEGLKPKQLVNSVSPVCGKSGCHIIKEQTTVSEFYKQFVEAIFSKPKHSISPRELLRVTSGAPIKFTKKWVNEFKNKNRTHQINIPQIYSSIEDYISNGKALSLIEEKSSPQKEQNIKINNQLFNNSNYLSIHEPSKEVEESTNPKDKGINKDEEILLKQEDEIKGEISSPQSIKMKRLLHSLDYSPQLPKVISIPQDQIIPLSSKHLPLTHEKEPLSSLMINIPPKKEITLQNENEFLIKAPALSKIEQNPISFIFHTYDIYKQFNNKKTPYFDILLNPLLEKLFNSQSSFARRYTYKRTKIKSNVYNISLKIYIKKNILTE
ncbi:hypothetical protein O181_115396 [Austropuccinia psidii MF-1]|uniref:Uncharacterized protein n=1 Tax=Austropuccinia psidii MF-1 TaxID=1389203 RepID=A0A9Q3K8S0_9BASI|nr:hypothetical protein [Austropuccinia psidii MF-1]